MRLLPLPVAIGAALVALVGVAGVARGVVPQHAAAAPGQPIVVTGAYVRQPASPDVAAAYFTVHNNTGQPDTLLSVVTGAGSSAVLHVDDSMSAVSGGLVVPAHGSVTLRAGGGHVMIEGLYGTLTVGQSVNLQLTFEKAGPIVVVAPVIGIFATPPAAGTS